MNDSDPLDEHEAVFSALQLFGNEPRGAPPQWHELDDFQQHRLPVERSAEVLSHIANSPIHFQQWLDLCEANEWVAEQSPSPTDKTTEYATDDKPAQSNSIPNSSTSLMERLQSWVAPLFAQPLPVYGGAFAAIIVAVLVIPLLRDSGPADLQGKFDRNAALFLAAAPEQEFAPPKNSTTRSLGGLLGPPTASDVEHHYFRLGLLRAQEKLLQSPGSAWVPWRDSLMNTPLDCKNPSARELCETAGPDFTQIGEWAMLAHLACLSPDSFSDDSFWQLQYEFYTELQQLPAMSSSELLQPTMALHQPVMPEALCFAVSELIQAGQ